MAILLKYSKKPFSGKFGQGGVVVDRNRTFGFAASQESYNDCSNIDWYRKVYVCDRNVSKNVLVRTKNFSSYTCALPSNGI